MIRALAIVAVLAGCTADRLVLDNTITDCAHAVRGAIGDRCDFATKCDAPIETCCTKTFSCVNNALVVDTACGPSCFPCTHDQDCAPGSICEGRFCSPCPICAPPECPANWLHLSRNGCTACECAPTPTCNFPGSEPGICPEGECYEGAVCEPDCIGPNPTCCNYQCSNPGCPTPVPTGCLMACPPPLAGVCSTCGADHCECTGTEWHCTAVCADGLHASCVAPP